MLKSICFFLIFLILSSGCGSSNEDADKSKINKNDKLKNQTTENASANSSLDEIRRTFNLAVIQKIEGAVENASVEEIRKIFNLEAAEEPRSEIRLILGNSKDTLNKALELAIRFGDENLVGEIIKKAGSNLNLDDFVSIAAERNNEKIIELFIEKGARFKYFSQLERVLSNLKSVKLLIEKNGLDVNINNDGVTALHIAARQRGNNIEVLEYLIKSGANVNAQDKYKTTPLMWAAEAGNLSALKALLDARADKNIVDTHGHTASMKAFQDKNVQNFINNYK